MSTKRYFDIIFSFIGLIFFSPFLIIITLTILMLMGRPIFFCQLRVGRYGKNFIIYKFRTMIECNNSNLIMRKSRITPLGAFLRKHKLDELPELLNVLKGDMSFVGPRPFLEQYTFKLEGEQKKILELRPGITGLDSLEFSKEEELLAAVEHPQEYKEKIIWPKKVRLNLNYYYDHSFFGDIKIIVKTIFQVW